MWASPRSRLNLWRAGPGFEEVFILEEGVERAQARPRKTRLASEPPRSPEMRTSAQAVAFRYLRVSCSSTMSCRRRNHEENAEHPR